MDNPIFNIGEKSFETDEIFNTVSHLVGAMFSLLGSVLLIVRAYMVGDIWQTIAFFIYGFSLVNLFLFSTFHHGINKAKEGNAFQVLDYTGIFLLIAGTFTPFCLTILRGWFGWSVFGVVWFISIVGIVLKSSIRRLPRSISNTFFLSLGWMGSVILFGLVRSNFNFLGMLLILLGGIFYSVGAVFYMKKIVLIEKRFGSHELFHIFVLMGALMHYAAIYMYVLEI